MLHQQNRNFKTEKLTLAEVVYTWFNRWDIFACRANRSVFVVLNFMVLPRWLKLHRVVRAELGKTSLSQLLLRVLEVLWIRALMKIAWHVRRPYRPLCYRGS